MESAGRTTWIPIKKRLLTLNVILDQTLAMDQPLWIISVDLSKAFDRVNWELLWQAVGDHGISPDVVWLLQNIYFQLVGKLLDHRKSVSNSTLHLGCDKGVFSAHVCFVQSLIRHCPSGGRNAMVLATVFFPRTFLTADCSITRTVLLVCLQAVGTMLAIYMPAAPGCAWEKAKSKPVSLGGGR